MEFKGVDLHKTKIAIIAAVSNNNVIGKDGKIPWHLSEDLKRFRSMTENHVVIMGQKTFESLNSVPLQSRFNIILSNDWEFEVPDGYPDDKNTEVAVVHDIESALVNAEYYNDNDLEVFIIGGGSLYREMMKYCYRLYITRIFKDFEGDTFFPEIEPWSWKLIWSEKHIGEEFDYEYQIYNINYD
jgi:dihydrofolate reductase